MIEDYCLDFKCKCGLRGGGTYSKDKVRSLFGGPPRKGMSTPCSQCKGKMVLLNVIFAPDVPLSVPTMDQYMEAT